jgi:hypothetical protein
MGPAAEARGRREEPRASRGRDPEEIGDGDSEKFATADLSPFHNAFKFICWIMIDIEIMGWRGWFL